MKKIFLILASIVLLGTINVKAMTESDLKTKLQNGFEIKGEVIKPTAYQLNEINRYLDKYEVSSDHLTYISNKIDEIYNIAKEAGAKSFTDLPSDKVGDIVKIVALISENTSVKASLTNNGVLTIYESDGKTPFTVIEDKDIAKKTGTNNTLFVIASFSAVFGTCYIAKRAIKEND